ncbi:MAG: DUF4442 domain-containing protein [Saprospiraceae bacterium]
MEKLAPVAAKYLHDIQSPGKLKLYFLKNLPSAAWWGLQVKSATPYRAEVVIPYNWRTKNPFRSIYFAALAGAGELSTGILANLARMGTVPISMLVVRQEAEFVKKATTPITFTCEEGALVQETVKKAVETRLPQTLRMTGTGRDATGEIVCKVYMTWSFKAKG